MNRLIVAFETENVTHRIADLLSSAALPVRASCSTGAEVIRTVRYMGGGVVVMSPKLADMTADQLYDNLDGNVLILAVGKPQQLELCECFNLFRLPLPVNRHDLAASVSLLLQLDEMESRRNRPHLNDPALIEKAKRILQEKNGFTEEQAHRYLQRQSMNAGTRMEEFARKIISAYEKKD